MDLDTKQKLLLAIYAEYQKDKPQMSNISAQALGIDEEVFVIALEKLKNEELVNEIEFFNTIGVTNIDNIDISNAKMSIRGIEYVENKLKIDQSLSGSEKVEAVNKTFLEAGMELLAQFTAKVLTEMAKSQL